MSLSRLLPSRTPNLARVLLVRNIAIIGEMREGPWPAKHLTVDPDVKGHFEYEHDVSRDHRYSKPQKPGDTPYRFLTRRLKHNYELYPLLCLGGFLTLILGATVYHAFRKIEIWLDKTHNEPPPWDWEKVRHNYWKKPTLWFDPAGRTHTRLFEMEQLQDEMMMAAKKRGTYYDRGHKND